MYKEFKIKKISGTFSELLEAYGLAKFIYDLLENLNCERIIVEIINETDYYKICSNIQIDDEMINRAGFFSIIKFIKKNNNESLPDDTLSYYDVNAQKELINEKKMNIKNIINNKLLNKEEKDRQIRAVKNLWNTEWGRGIDYEYDVYSNICRNPYASFKTIYKNILLFKNDRFPELIKLILDYYSNDEGEYYYELITTNKVSSQQLYSPNQAKGLNNKLANGLNSINIKEPWISALMKISGSLIMMSCHSVKAGGKWDMKIFVPEFKKVNIFNAREINKNYKLLTKGVSPIKTDIMHIINYMVTFLNEIDINNEENFQNTLLGFYTVYHKDMGQTKMITNIAYLGVPNFINYNNNDEKNNWINILKKCGSIIIKIKELGENIEGLKYFRNFLSESKIEELFSFFRWFSTIIISEEIKSYNLFSINLLNNLFNAMDINLSSIISNEGFIAISKAIRNSTVSLQFTPKQNRKFDVKYGFAQNLINKSKTKEELATFIGNFIGEYNSQTARYKEKNPGKICRAIVKKEELDEFMKLLDDKDSKLIASLLSAYGYALKRNDDIGNEEYDNIEDEIIPEDESESNL